MGKYVFLILCRNINMPKNTPAEAKKTAIKKSQASGIRSPPLMLFLLSMPTKIKEKRFIRSSVVPISVELVIIIFGYIN